MNNTEAKLVSCDSESWYSEEGSLIILRQSGLLLRMKLRTNVDHNCLLIALQHAGIHTV